MWYFEVKFGKNCLIGGHFYSKEELLDWFHIHLKEYILIDNAYEIKIYYEEEGEEDE